MCARPDARAAAVAVKCGAKRTAAQSQADAAARPRATVRSSGAASKDAINSGSGVKAWRIERRACAAGSVSVGCFDSAVTEHADQAATDAADAMRKAVRSLGAAVLAALRRAAVRWCRRRGGVESKPDAGRRAAVGWRVAWSRCVRISVGAKLVWRC